MSEPESGSSSSSPGGSRVGRFAKRRAGLLLVLAVVGVLLYAQWPIVRGAGYAMLGLDPPQSDIAWQDDFEAVLDQASRNDQPVLAYFTADWCGPCNVMKQSTWPDGRVEAAAEGYQAVMIDVDDPAHAELMQRYMVNAVPTVLILDEQGSVVERDGFMSGRAMAGFLREHAEGR